MLTGIAVEGLFDPRASGMRFIMFEMRRDLTFLVKSDPSLASRAAHKPLPWHPSTMIETDRIPALVRPKLAVMKGHGVGIATGAS
jgi:hypothetical protein